MHLVPHLNEKNELFDGTYIKALSLCKKNCQSNRCQSFYQSLKSECKDGFHTCPFGLSTFVKNVNGKKIIFTSFREENTYTRKNKTFSGDKAYNPVLSKEQIYSLINCTLNESLLEKKLEESHQSIDTAFHEVKKLNAKLKEHCDAIFSYYGDKTDVYALSPGEYSNLFDRIKTLYVICTMIDARYSMYGYELNNHGLIQGNPINTNIYKKFDKCQKILKNYQKKNVPISLSGSSFMGIKAYPSFEMIPFLLLENALKYSKEGEKVTISFSSTNEKLSVTIHSISPFCSAEELAHITDKGFRGENAKKKADGSGIGLFFTSKLCEIHSIKISFKSDPSTKKIDSGIVYADFTVTLEFDNIFDMSDDEL